MICGLSSMAGWLRSSRHRRGASSPRAGRRSRYARPSAAGNRRTFPIPTSPRAAGVPTSGTTSPAGRAWAPDPDWARERDPAKSESLYREAWSRFVNVLGQRELPRLDREVSGVNYRIPTPGLRAQGGVVSCSLELPGFALRYTTDGTEPTVRSALVRGPIPFRGTIRVAAFSATGRKGHTAHLTAEPASPPPRGASGRSRDRRGRD